MLLLRAMRLILLWEIISIKSALAKCKSCSSGRTPASTALAPRKFASKLKIISLILELGVVTSELKNS